VLIGRINVLESLEALGQVEPASEMIGPLTEDCKDRFGAEHPRTARVAEIGADLRGTAGDIDGTIAEYERLVALRCRLHGAEHPDSVHARRRLAHWREQARLDPVQGHSR
jgi:hypothetical protein